MKCCLACFEEKSEFPIIQNKEKKICKDCYNNLYGSIDEAAEKIKAKKKRKERNLIIRNQKYMIDLLKLKGCMECKTKNYLVLDFKRNLDSIKTINISCGKFTLKQLKKEIDDAHVICSNCFNIRMFNLKNAKEF